MVYFSFRVFLSVHILINLNKEAFIWHVTCYTRNVFKDSHLKMGLDCPGDRGMLESIAS